MTRQRADGVLVVAGGVGFSVRGRIAQLALQNRMPTMAAFREFASPNIVEIYRRGATFVDRMLKGAKPAELPVEQPPTYELAINVATARALGLTIPQTLLVRADHLID